MAKNKEQYIYIVQSSKETTKCKIGKTNENDFEKCLKEYNITEKSKKNNYKYLFICEVKNMTQVENSIKETFCTLREEKSKEIYSYNAQLFEHYVNFIKSHKMFVAELFNKTHKEKEDEIKKRLEKITMLERRYFIDWLRINYSIFYIAQDIKSIIMAIDYSRAREEYEEINDLLNNITDHCKWEIDENLYIKAEKDGLYIKPDKNELISELTEKEKKLFYTSIKRKVSII